jgi:hypothetical protein
MIRDFLLDYIIPANVRMRNQPLEGATVNFLSNGGTLADYTQGRYRSIIMFAIDCNVDPDEQFELMIATQQTRRELQPMCVGGLMSVRVNRQISIQAKRESARAVQTVHGIYGVLETHMLNGEMKQPYPDWVKFHAPTQSMVLRSDAADGEILYAQTICLDTDATRLSRSAANEVMRKYYEDNGLIDRDLFDIAYDGNHRMLH